ncbi:MAG: tRNA (adenosine(37)-N6)-dimethylallyltransferase MiaA [Sphingomicrobium sp.]
MINPLPPLALIAGPTASGKSALGLAYARRSGGVIVNADSAQLYRDLPIISAAPTAAEQAEVEHRLYGVRDGADPCSAADWAELAKAEINELHCADKLPILVGGTGLYLRTLLDGIAPVPAIDPAIRAEVRAATVADNRLQLERLDPGGASRLDAADTTRIARALEVVRSTGQTLAHWQQHLDGGIAGQVALSPLILLPPRDWLIARCDQRFADMLDQGAIEEVARLVERGLNPELPVMRAIGLREIAEGGDRADMIARGQLATRRYAKRQTTWFSNQPPSDWPRFTAPLDSPQAIDDALALLTP